MFFLLMELFHHDSGHCLRFPSLRLSDHLPVRPFVRPTATLYPRSSVPLSVHQPAHQTTSMNDCPTA